MGGETTLSQIEALLMIKFTKSQGVTAKKGGTW
jgi:hypothetical protein